MQDSEVLLNQAFKAGKHEAFEELCRTHGPGIYKLVLRKLGRAEADDVYQEALKAAWQGHSSFRVAQGFGPWFYRIARNKVADFLRQKYKESVLASLDDDRKGQTKSKRESVRAKDTSDEGLGYELTEWLRAHLGPSDRILANMLGEGVGRPEIGEQLHLTPDQVRDRVARIRSRLEPYKNQLRHKK